MQLAVGVPAAGGWDVNPELGGVDEDDEIGWESEDDVEIAPDDSLADVLLRRNVQDMLWRMPRGEIHMKVGTRMGIKNSHFRRLRMLLRERKVVTVEFEPDAPLESFTEALRGDRTDRSNLSRVLGTLTLPNKYVVLFGERDFVSTLLVDPYIIAEL